MTHQETPRGPVTHDLKCWPGPFQALLVGDKTAEWRKADRDYQVGDTLHMQEWVPHFAADGTLKDGEYTGRTLDLTVTHIIREGYGIPEGYCMMSVRLLSSLHQETPIQTVIREMQEYRKATRDEDYPTNIVRVAEARFMRWLDLLSSSSQGSGPSIAANCTEVRCSECKETVPFGGQVKRCSCGLVTVVGGGVRLTPTSKANGTIPIELAQPPTKGGG